MSAARIAALLLATCTLACGGADTVDETADETVSAMTVDGPATVASHARPGRLEATPDVTAKPHAIETASFAGSLDAGLAAEHGPIPVVPGTTIVLSVDGTGDPDLTARFDAVPTADDFDCLGISEGADTCTLVVPAGASFLVARVVATRSTEYLLVAVRP